MRPVFLYLIGQLGLGGYEQQLYYLLQAIDRQRYRPAVAVWGSGGVSAYAAKIRALGVPLYTFPADFTPHAKVLALRHLVRALSPELLHSYSFFTNFPAWWCTVGTHTTPVGSIRNNFILERRGAGRMLGRLSARWPSFHICNSVAAKHAVDQSLWPFKPSRLMVVRNRLDLKRFRPEPMLPSQPVLLAIGRFFPEKRWDRLINVVAMVKARGVKLLVHLVGDGPLRESLEAQVTRLGVDDMIQFFGVRHGIEQLMADSWFLVHTADQEGCPNVVMEAMACGRAVVATDAGDIPDLVDDGKTGFVVRRGEDGSLAERIMTLVSSREVCSSMGQAGRRKAEQEFGLNRLVHETLSAYHEAGWTG